VNTDRPSLLGISLIALLDAFPALRPRLWRWWYDALARRDQAGELLLMNFGFDDGTPLELSSALEPYRYPLQLYERVASAAALEGNAVLEVGCGRGGGAAFLVRRHRPASYLGVDLSPEAIAWCRQQHHESGLRFAEGHADALPADDASVDAVLNVESSHCYPSMPDFLREVRRVLKPEGRFAFCDLRSSKGWEQTRGEFADAGLHIIEEECINDAVLRALDKVAPQRDERIDARVPRPWRRMFRDFVGVRGGALYGMLKDGRLRYMRVLARR
jgi:SAM-dependent methyltransferase